MRHPDQMRNLLLAALPASGLARLTSHLVSVNLEHGQGIYEPRGSLRHVYFPTTSVISPLYVTTEGAPTEIAIAGNEGEAELHFSWAGETACGKSIGVTFLVLRSILAICEFH
ncbi:hypothetical protein OH764_26210 [Burkholderia sp. M6-3]